MKAAVVLCCLLFGCATEPLNEYERNDELQITRENWGACQAKAQVVYSKHPHRKHKRHTRWELYEDLLINHCRTRLGSGWQE